MHEYCDMPLFVLIMFSRIDLYSNDSKVPNSAKQKHQQQ
jgi:hypothetical protein